MDAWYCWEMMLYYVGTYNIHTLWEKGFDKLICLFFYLSASVTQIFPTLQSGGATHKASWLQVLMEDRGQEKQRGIFLGLELC